MKKLITLLSFFLITSSGFSQIDWSFVLDDNAYCKSQPTDLIVLSDSVVIIGGYMNIKSCYYSMIAAYDFKSNLIWKRYLGADKFKVDTSGVYAVGYNIGVDDVGNDEHLVFSKLDYNGDTLFYNTYPKIPYDYYQYEGDFIFHPIDFVVSANNKEFLVLSEQGLIKTDSLGNLKWLKENIVTHNQKNISFLDEENYLLACDSSLFLLDSSAIVLDSILFDKKIEHCKVANDTIYALFQNQKVVLFDTTFIALDTFDFALYFDSVKDLMFENNTLWISGKKDEKLKFCSLNLSSQEAKFYSVDEFTNYISFYVSNGSLFVLGKSKSSQVNFTKFTLSPTEEIFDVSFPDLELRDFLVDSTSLRYFNGEKTFAIGYDFYSRVVIQNNSDETINSLAIYSDLAGGINCFQNQLYEKVNLTLLPNMLDTIVIGWRYQDNVNNNVLCFECLAANSNPEIDITNNKLCKTIEVKTGVYNEPFMNEIRVYPNPFKNITWVNSPSNIESLIVTDISGKTIIQEKNPGWEYQIDLTSYKPGIYLLYINVNNHRTIRKIVKDIPK